MGWQEETNVLNKWQDNLQKRIEELESNLKYLNVIIKQGYVNNNDFALAKNLLEDSQAINEELGVYFKKRYEDDVGF